jgi:hypothetical protein
LPAKDGPKLNKNPKKKQINNKKKKERKSESGKKE